MDFDKPKVYGDTFISDGLVFIRMFLNDRPPGDDSNFKLVVFFIINGCLLFKQNIVENRMNNLLQCH